MKMIVYNVQNSGNPFGFKNSNTLKKIRIQSRASEGTRPFSQKCARKKLTSKNINFLKGLGFKVNKH